MLNKAEIIKAARTAENDDPQLSVQHSPAPAERLALQGMEALFSIGNLRDQFYRVESGALLVVMSNGQDNCHDCQVAGPGDYVGLGFTPTYTISAHALEHTIVSCYSMSHVRKLAATDLRLRSQLERDTAREFSSRRAMMLSDLQQITPLQKVARLILALSAVASREGRDLRSVSDALSGDFTAGLLGIDVDVFSRSVSSLAAQGLIKNDLETGTVVADTAGLEVLSQTRASGS